MQLELPVMSKELSEAISRVEALAAERDRIEGVLQTERVRLRDHVADLEGIRANLSASESEAALSDNASDPKLRRRYLDARDEVELVTARAAGVAGRLAVADRDLADARVRLRQTFEHWRAAEVSKSAERLMAAMEPFIAALTREFVVAAALNDKRTLVAIRSIDLFDPLHPGERKLFHGNSLRGGRFRSDADADECSASFAAVKLRVSALLGADAVQAEASSQESELSR